MEEVAGETPELMEEAAGETPEQIEIEGDERETTQGFEVSDAHNYGA